MVQRSSGLRKPGREHVNHNNNNDNNTVNNICIYIYIYICLQRFRHRTPRRQSKQTPTRVLLHAPDVEMQHVVAYWSGKIVTLRDYPKTTMAARVEPKW